jgi:phage baseplate assembly protein gpV
MGRDEDVIENDPDSLEHVAGQVEAIHDHFQKSKEKMTGIVGENPFGAIKHPDDRPGEHPSDGIANALGSYRDGMHRQFDAAAKLMLSTGGVLREAAGAMRETDAAAADSLTVKDGTLQV